MRTRSSDQPSVKNPPQPESTVAESTAPASKLMAPKPTRRSRRSVHKRPSEGHALVKLYSEQSYRFGEHGLEASPSQHAAVLNWKKHNRPNTPNEKPLISVALEALAELTHALPRENTRESSSKRKEPSESTPQTRADKPVDKSIINPEDKQVHHQAEEPETKEEEEEDKKEEGGDESETAEPTKRPRMSDENVEGDADEKKDDDVDESSVPIVPALEKSSKSSRFFEDYSQAFMPARGVLKHISAGCERMGAVLCPKCHVPREFCFDSDCKFLADGFYDYVVDSNVALVHDTRWYSLSVIVGTLFSSEACMAVTRFVCAANKKYAPCIIERIVSLKKPATDVQRRRLERDIAASSLFNGKRRMYRLLYRAVPLWWENAISLHSGSQCATVLKNRAFNLDNCITSISSFICPIWSMAWEQFDPATFIADVTQMLQSDAALCWMNASSLYTAVASVKFTTFTNQMPLTYLVALAVLHPRSSPQCLMQLLTLIATEADKKFQTKERSRLFTRMDPVLRVMMDSPRDIDDTGHCGSHAVRLKSAAQLFQLALLLIACRFRVSHSRMLVDGHFYKNAVMHRNTTFKQFSFQISSLYICEATAIAKFTPYVSTLAGMLTHDLIKSMNHSYTEWVPQCVGFVKAVVRTAQGLVTRKPELTCISNAITSGEWNHAFWRYLGWSKPMATTYREISQIVPVSLGTHFCIDPTPMRISLMDAIEDITGTGPRANNPLVICLYNVYCGNSMKPTDIRAAGVKIKECVNDLLG